MEKKTKKLLIGGGIAAVVIGVAYVLLKKTSGTVNQTQAVTPGTPSTPSTPGGSPAAKPPVVFNHGFPAGSALRINNNDKVFVVNSEGIRQWVTSRAKLESMGIKLSNVVSITQAEMDRIPLGANLAGLGNITHLLG